MFGKLSCALVELKDIYSPSTVEGKGRLSALASSLITGVYNVFITGIFYTGFLTMYDISITGVGIVTFIPYIANCFCLFSANVLGHFKHRKRVLLASKIFFYAMYILATTLMPLFVTGPQARLYWLVGILFVAHAVYALFSPGFTTWFYHFFPHDTEKRTKYFVYNQFFTTILAHTVLVLSGWIADAVKASSAQNQLILGFRYFAFLLVIVDVFMQAQAKEYDETEEHKVRLTEVFTVPFQYKKYMYCMALMCFWSFNANLSNGLWNYHLLNHMHFPYLLINAVSASYVVIFAITASKWRSLLRKYSWIKTFGIANLLWAPTEFAFFCMTPDRGWMFPVLAVIQHLLSVGMNLSYANVLYMNLPEKNATTCIAFQAVICNFASFLGLVTGTELAKITGDSTMMFLGMPLYSVLFTCILRGINMAVIGYVCFRYWKVFSDESAGE